MYDELEQLRKLARSIELEAMAKPDVEEHDPDLGITVLDAEMGNQPYDPDPRVNAYIVKGDDDDEKAVDESPKDPKETKSSVGSCAPPAKGAKQKEAIFGSQDEEAERAMEEGLGLHVGGLSLHKSLKNGLSECMDLCDPNCEIKFDIGDFVKPTCSETPVILVVKCTDGSNIMTAKPTECADECSETGCWPEFSFEQDEIEPMNDIKLSDIFNVMKFNDTAKTESFNGGTYDEEPMKAARKVASANQRDKKAASFDDINEFMEDVFGPVPDYTVKQKITPNQPQEQRVKFGFTGAL